jgi:hypothetical protein
MLRKPKWRKKPAQPTGLGQSVKQVLIGAAFRSQF